MIIKCKTCDETFTKNSELETRMKSCHYAEEFKCDQCPKTFVLKWRLQKYQSNHSNMENMKGVHFYNNNKICAFKELGCT